MDCRSPTEAALLSPSPLEPGSIKDYREEVILLLSSARQLAAKSICKAQKRYKDAYDHRAVQVNHQVVNWVLVRFPQEESGKNRKLSQPWHGPYWFVARTNPDITVVKVDHLKIGLIQVHQSRVSSYPLDFPAGYFWYGAQRHSPGCPQKWLQRMLQGGPDARPQTADVEAEAANLRDSDTESLPPVE